jgi:aminomethyltransferase
LGEIHAAAGAKLTEFGGWEMPVKFDSIQTEHRAVRETVGKFDVSHMGELAVSGPDATELMNRLTTNDVTALAPGEAQYSTITDADGILLDDTVVYRLPEDGGPAGDFEYLFVPNAGHDAAMSDRWRTHADKWELDVAVENATEALGMIAVQGPAAIEHLETLCEAPGNIDRFTADARPVAGVECLVARTGYTGEDGVELLFDADESAALWSSIECQSCGLGARDTLRLEAGFVLSGREFDPETNPRTPHEAELGFVVDLAEPFVGRDPLAAPGASDPDERLIGFRLLDRGIARNGYDIILDGETIGTVTSGTMSPTLEEAIGLGYVPATHADPGTELGVVIRGETRRAIVVERPFV